MIAIGYNTAGTGLTRAMHSIMRRLADRHEIHFLGLGYSGEIVRDRGLTLYATNATGGDVFAAFQARRLIEEVQPALIFIMHDIWVFDHYVRLLGPYRDRLKTWPTFPSTAESRTRRTPRRVIRGPERQPPRQAQTR